MPLFAQQLNPLMKMNLTRSDILRATFTLPDMQGHPEPATDDNIQVKGRPMPLEYLQCSKQSLLRQNRTQNSTTLPARVHSQTRNTFDTNIGNFTNSEPEVVGNNGQSTKRLPRVRCYSSKSYLKLGDTTSQRGNALVNEDDKEDEIITEPFIITHTHGQRKESRKSSKLNNSVKFKNGVIFKAVEPRTQEFEEEGDKEVALLRCSSKGQRNRNEAAATQSQKRIKSSEKPGTAGPTQGRNKGLKPNQDIIEGSLVSKEDLHQSNRSLNREENSKN